MSDETARQLVTEEDRQQFQAARRTGGVCAACGRPLADGESVWHERFVMLGSPRAVYWATVGRECASPELLAETEGTAPEPCIWCGRPVHYSLDPVKPGNARTRALCCRRCGSRYEAEQRRQRAKGEG